MSDQPILTEPSPAPEIYVDGYASHTVVNSMAKFTFFSAGHNPTNQGRENRIVLRLTTPLSTVMGLHKAFGELLVELERQMGTTDAAQ